MVEMNKTFLRIAIGIATRLGRKIAEMNTENRKIVLDIANFFGCSAWFIVMDINLWRMEGLSRPVGISIGVTFAAVYCQGIWNGLLAGSGRTSMWQWWRESRGAGKDAVKKPQ
jgi:hypothetical protein